MQTLLFLSTTEYSEIQPETPTTVALSPGGVKSGWKSTRPAMATFEEECAWADQWIEELEGAQQAA